MALCGALLWAASSAAGLLTEAAEGASVDRETRAWVLDCATLSDEQLEAFEARARAELLLRETHSLVELRCDGDAATLSLRGQDSSLATEAVTLSSNDPVGELLVGLVRLVEKTLQDGAGPPSAPQEAPAETPTETPTPASTPETPPVAPAVSPSSPERAPRPSHATSEAKRSVLLSAGVSVLGSSSVYLGPEVAVALRLGEHWSAGVGLAANWMPVPIDGFAFSEVSTLLAVGWRYEWVGVVAGPSGSLVVSEAPSDLVLQRSNVVPRIGVVLRPYVELTWGMWGLQVGGTLRWFHTTVEQRVADDPVTDSSRLVAARSDVDGGGYAAVTVTF